ncbi:hypothetical protein SALWKB2_1692 [Snodgrassella alvi wkB2]|nr:hypothetical protein SALWKB2_1692 [Snodgrassella alvi wkB2]
MTVIPLFIIGEASLSNIPGTEKKMNTNKSSNQNAIKINKIGNYLPVSEY